MPIQNPQLDAAGILRLQRAMLVVEDVMREVGMPEAAEFLMDFVAELKPGYDPDLNFWAAVVRKYQVASERATGLPKELVEAIDDHVNRLELYHEQEWEPDNDGDFLIAVQPSYTGGGYRYGPMIYFGRGYISSLALEHFSPDIVDGLHAAGEITDEEREYVLALIGDLEE